MWLLRAAVLLVIIGGCSTIDKAIEAPARGAVDPYSYSSVGAQFDLPVDANEQVRLMATEIGWNGTTHWLASIEQQEGHEVRSEPRPRFYLEFRSWEPPIQREDGVGEYRYTIYNYEISADAYRVLIGEIRELLPVAEGGSACSHCLVLRVDGALDGEAFAASATPAASEYERLAEIGQVLFDALGSQSGALEPIAGEFASRTGRARTEKIELLKRIPGRSAGQ
jgi:hypothetical protein